MPKRIPEQELDAILAVVAGHREGARVRAIREGLPYELPPRMLQRRLALLIEQKRLIAEGQRKGRRYRVPVTITDKSTLVVGSMIIEASGDIYVPVSPEAEPIKKAIRAPIQKRQPVGYQRTFLDDYRPNVTYYLSAEMRQRLLDMGCSPDGKRPAGTYARTIYNRLLIDLSWNSSRLEGNTYSLLETERLLELGEAAEGKDVLEAQASGRLRCIPVGIGGTVYHPLEVPQLIEKCFEKILNTAAAITDPFEQAFFALVHLAYL